MKKFVIISVLLLVFIMSACNHSSTENNDLPGDRPPKVNIQIDGETYETKLGSYCWTISKGKGECVDTAGPEVLMKDEEPIRMKAGGQIKLDMDYTPKPNGFHLSRISNEKAIEVELMNDQFTVPEEKGVYFYAYSVWWSDDEDKNVSHGDAFYAFAIEVQ